jgi:Uma2 family endonuclease
MGEMWPLLRLPGSSGTDRLIKARLYAQSGVPEYWIVDVDANVIEVRTGPAAGTYTRVELLGKGVRIPLVRFPEVSLSTDAILR